MIRRSLAAILLSLACVAAADAQSTIFLVRHAERADGGTAPAGMMTADPDLSAAGQARAAALAAVLKDAKITAIFTTELKRTRQTAAPLATALGLAVTQLPSTDLPALVKRLEAASGNVLVVGHSNSVPETIKLLGIDDTITIGDQEFDNLFVISRTSRPSLVRLRYR